MYKSHFFKTAQRPSPLLAKYHIVPMYLGQTDRCHTKNNSCRGKETHAESETTK